ncbi:MAG: lipopolysaccharide biosynthesis protein [Bacteroidota bacterium]
MLTKLLRQSGTYAVANVVAKGSGFVLLAFYQNPAYLAQAEFGYLGGLDALKGLAVLVAGVGLPLGLIRFASAGDLDDRERAAVPATSLALAVVAGSAVAALGWGLASPVAAALLGDAALADPVRWLAAYVALKTVADISYTEIRRRERADLYVAASLVETVVLVGAVAYFLAAAGEGLIGVMKGYVVSTGVMAAGLTPLLLANVERRLRWSLVGPMLAFGLPLIASGLANRFLNIGDRFLILHFLGPEANAAYEWAARFGGILNSLLVQSFQMAFVVLGLKALDADGTPDLHRRTFRHYTALAGFAVLGLGLFATDLARLLPIVEAAVTSVLGVAVGPIPERGGEIASVYLQQEGLIALIAGGFAFYGLYVLAVTVLYAAGRTRAVAASVGGAALLNLVLNVVLIPTVGLLGAAIATLASYAALAFATAILGERESRAGYPWRVLAVVSGLVVVLWAAGQTVADEALPSRLGVRAGLVIAYLAALVAAGIYRREDWDRLRALGRRSGGPEAGREHADTSR